MRRCRLKKKKELDQLRRTANVTTAALQGAKMLLESQGKERSDIYAVGDATRKLAAEHMQKLVLMAPTVAPQGEEGEIKEGEPEEAEECSDAEDEEAEECFEECFDAEDEEVRSNHQWKPHQGMPLKLPLTEEERVIFFNMDEPIVLSTMANRLCQEAFEDFVPAVSRQDGLGGILYQVAHDLEKEVEKDMRYLLGGRGKVQHGRNRVYQMSNPAEYERRTLRLMHRLCPNWELKHYNHAARCREEEIADLKNEMAYMEDEIVDLKDENAYLNRQLRLKRGHDDDENHNRLGKRPRQYY